MTSLSDSGPPRSSIVINPHTHRATNMLTSKQTHKHGCKFVFAYCSELHGHALFAKALPLSEGSSVTDTNYCSLSTYKAEAQSGTKPWGEYDIQCEMFDKSTISFPIQI